MPPPSPTAEEVASVFPDTCMFLYGQAEVARVELTGVENRLGVACRLGAYTVQIERSTEPFPHLVVGV